MPSISSYPLDDLSALDRIMSETQMQRSAAIDKAWAYYHRQHRRPLKVKTGQVDDNVIINLAREVVDQSVAMLFGQPPDFEIDDASETPEEMALEQIWKDNNLPIWCQNVGVAGALAGHVFVKLAPGETDVRIVRLNPRYVSVFWREDDFERIVAFRIQWADGRATQRQDIVDLSGGWLVRDLVMPSGGREWTLLNEALWPWPWAPIVEWQNLPDPEGHYGAPDLVNVELNDAANFIASNAARIIKYHAHPKTVVVGAQMTDIKDTPVDGIWSIPKADARITNLEMQSDLTSSMAYLQFLQARFYAEHKAVNLASMADRLGQMTNFGLRVLFKEALDKLETKRALYGAGLAEISRRALLLLGFGDMGVRVIWPDVLPYNRLDQVQALQMERDMQIVSRKTMATELGRDWETEQARIQEEQQTEGNVGTVLLRAFEQGQMEPGAVDGQMLRGSDGTTG